MAEVCQTMLAQSSSNVEGRISSAGFPAKKELQKATAVAAMILCQKIAYARR
jgi:hypothetical protein